MLTYREATRFHGKTRALGLWARPENVMPVMHFTIAGDAEENSRQNQFAESENPTALKDAECHADSRGDPGTQPDLKQPVILGVDDTANVRESQKILLEKNEYRVLTATNGKEGIHAFVANSVDLVLLDCHLPGRVGDAVASVLSPNPNRFPAFWIGTARDGSSNQPLFKTDE